MKLIIFYFTQRLYLIVINKILIFKNIVLLKWPPSFYIQSAIRLHIYYYSANKRRNGKKHVDLQAKCDITCMMIIDSLAKNVFILY